MTTPTAAASLGERTGEPCTVCPEWIVQCAHFDGQIVVLGDRRMAKGRHVGCIFAGVSKGYFVGVTDKWEYKCSPPCNELSAYATAGTDKCDDLAAAQDEFDRRAEALRQGAA